MKKELVIMIKIKNVYGNELAYPFCPIAKGFTKLLGQSTLTDENINHIKALGYKIEEI